MVGGKQRKVVHYSGQVQGVGFRYTARRIAGRFDVAGYVQNLADGRVRLVVEGLEAEISGFMQEIATTFADNLTDIDAQEAPPAGEFDGFEIRL